jgi:hypothetical protein
MKAALLLAGFLGLAVATFAFCFTATQEPRQPLWDKSPEVQAAREAHIAKGQALGLYGHVDREGGVARCYVGPAFYGLRPIDQERVVKPIHAWAFTGREASAATLVFDNTGKRLAIYTAEAGLQWEK